MINTDSTKLSEWRQQSFRSFSNSQSKYYFSYIYFIQRNEFSMISPKEIHLEKNMNESYIDSTNIFTMLDTPKNLINLKSLNEKESPQLDLPFSISANKVFLIYFFEII